jgi:two-component system sensor histidine kinase VanS
VVLTVENTGAHLTPQLVSTLAEPFRRGTDRLHTGLGLGLAIVRSITQAHDGTLTLSPRTTGGLRVTVHLPRHRGDTQPGTGRTSLAPAGTRSVDTDE